MGCSEHKFYLFYFLYLFYYIVSAIYITINIVLNFFYILFYIDISYQLLNKSILLPASYLSLETNPT